MPIEETDYRHFDSDFIPIETLTFDIGSSSRQFRNVFCHNIFSKGFIQSGQIRITNEQLSDDLNEGIQTGNEYLRNLEYDVSDDIMKKMGNVIELQLNTSVIGISYTVEAIVNHGIIQRTLYPEMTETAIIGSPSNVFKEIHVLNPYIYGTFDANEIVSEDMFGKNISASNFYGNGEFIDNITHFGLLTSNVNPKYDKILDIGNDDQMFRKIHTDTLVANKLDIKGKSIRFDVSGICEIDTDKFYMNFANLSFKNQTIDYFTQYIDLKNGEFSVKESGIYSVSLFGIKSNRSQNLDNNIVWYVYHYNRVLGRGSSTRIEGQRPYSIIMGKLDRIRVQIDPQNNVPLKFEQGVMVFVQDIALPNLDDYFDPL